MADNLSLDKIYQPIRDDLKRVEERLRTLCQVDSPLLAELLDYCLQSGGKLLRPALVLLAGRFYHYHPEHLIAMAAAVELIHSATLVHDDVIDNSPVRRGRPTVNSIWGNDHALLLGDYLFAQAEELSAATNNPHVVQLCARTIMIIARGELHQNADAFNLNQTRQQYLERIARKTAALISLATECGAIISQAPEPAVRALKNYAYDLGVAFQIVDDMLDFIGTETELGKPVGSDLVQGTLTLPAMLILEQYPEDNPVTRIFHGDHSQHNITEAIALIRDSGIADDCYQLAADYAAAACRHLEILSEYPSRQALVNLAQYVVSRRQ